MRAIVVSDEFQGEGDGLVVPGEQDIANMYLHHELKQRVDATEGVKKQCVNGMFGGLLNRVADVGLVTLQLVTLGNATKVINGNGKSSILNQRTTYTRIERQLVKLARQQKDLIHKMANDVNLAHGEHAMKAVIEQSDKLKGSDPGAIRLSGIVGPTQAVYNNKKYKLKLNRIASGRFTQFFEKNGCDRLHLFDKGTAERHFKRHGGGQIEANVYVLHPKLDGVLVPILSYHKDLCNQLDKEVKLALGKLGAKELVIKKSRKSKIRSWWKSKSGSAQAQGGQNREESIEMTWGSPTFDPEHATAGCSLIQTSEWMTLIDLLKDTDQTGYKKGIEIDTTFNLGVDVVQLIDSSFEWESVSQYYYDVKFFSKDDIERAKANGVGSESAYDW